MRDFATSLLRAVIPPLLSAILLCGFSVQASAQSPLVVEDLQCKGNATTSCAFILSHLYLDPGDLLDEEEIQNAKLRLTASLLFDAVDVYLEKGSERGRIRVIVEVTESDPVVTEALAGTSFRLASLSQVLSGRIGHQNLFGAGKILDFEASGRIPIDGPKREDVYARLQYVDPHLLDSKRYFLIGDAGYRESYIESRHGDFYAVDFKSIGLAAGRRFFDFSYVLLEYRHRFDGHYSFSERLSDGTIDSGSDGFEYDIWTLGYGWNSEDDPWFPTRGSQFSWHVSRVFNDEFHFLAFRKTWRTQGGSIWSARIGGAGGTKFRVLQDEGFGFAVSYGRSLQTSPDGAIHRGRWYVEPGANDAPGYPEWADVIEVGVKLGVRFEVGSFGIVDLYLIGSTDVDTGADR